MQYQIFQNSRVNAEWVVLSSGLGGHGSFWQPQIEALRENFHIFVYDQEGCHKGSALLDRDYSMQDMAVQLFDLLQEIDLEKFHFIGHALGGFIGAELARLIKATSLDMQSFTVINGWSDLDPHTLKCFKTRIELLKCAGESAYVAAQALFLYPPDWISKHHQLISQQEVKQLENFPPKHNVLMRLKALMQYRMSPETATALHKIPMHILVNLDDFLVPSLQSSQLKMQFPHSKLTILEHGGHASTVTESERVNGLLITFLKSKDQYLSAS